MEIRKQYTEHKGAWWYHWVILYENGIEIEKNKIALTDLDDYIIKVENSGYEKAWTDKQIAEVKQAIFDLNERYDYMCANRLVAPKGEK